MDDFEILKILVPFFVCWIGGTELLQDDETGQTFVTKYAKIGYKTIAEFCRKIWEYTEQKPSRNRRRKMGKKTTPLPRNFPKT